MENLFGGWGGFLVVTQSLSHVQKWTFDIHIRKGGIRNRRTLFRTLSTSSIRYSLPLNILITLTATFVRTRSNQTKPTKHAHRAKRAHESHGTPRQAEAPHSADLPCRLACRGFAGTSVPPSASSARRDEQSVAPALQYVLG